MDHSTEKHVSPINNKNNATSADGTRTSKSHDEVSVTPSTSISSIAASSLRTSASRTYVDSPYLKSWQLLNMDTQEDGTYHDKNDDYQYNRNTILSGKHNENNRGTIKPAYESPLTRSAISSLPPRTHGHLFNEAAENTTGPAYSTTSSIYGTKNTKRSLEDDDPSDSAANILDHLTLTIASSSVHSSIESPDKITGSRREETVRSTGMKETNNFDRYGNKNAPLFSPGNNLNSPPWEGATSYNNAQTESTLDWESSSRVQQQSQHLTSSQLSRPSTSNADAYATGEYERDGNQLNTNEETPVRKARPKNDDDYNYDDEHIVNDNIDSIINNIGVSRNGDDDDVRPTPHAAAATNQDEFIPSAKKHLRELMSAMLLVVSPRSDTYEINTINVRKIMESCKQDQETLQGKLRKVLEEDTDATGHIEDLFALNEEILAAMEAGKDTLKREKERTKRKKAAEGPTIDILEENKDVFSLICMLRAPNEKRMQAALALMKFSKEDQVLSDEIISSGGIHSFLTLFQQTRAMTRELKVVASLAVAYILPSYVASSQTTSSIGLKLVKSLHYLSTSNPVSPNGVVITIEEMCKAASVGVNVLWVNSIQPMIAIKRAKNASSSSPPSLRPGKTVRYGRLRSRTG